MGAYLSQPILDKETEDGEPCRPCPKGRKESRQSERERDSTSAATAVRVLANARMQESSKDLVSVRRDEVHWTLPNLDPLRSIPFTEGVNRRLGFSPSLLNVAWLLGGQEPMR